MIVPSHRCGDRLFAFVVDQIIAGMLAAKLGRGSGPKKLARATEWGSSG
jgi:hypothetical protein